MGLLDGRVAIVTGGGRGIGREHCLELARHGATVVVNDVGVSLRGDATGESPADSVAAEIREKGGQAIPDRTSVVDWNAAAELVQRVVAEFGHLDVVVNNAGIVREGRIHDVTEDDWDSVFDVHVKGSFTVTRQACEYWRSAAKSGHRVSGRIINTTSRAGLFGIQGLTVYGTAKAAIVGLTMSTALEMERYGVTANAICPIAMTRMLASSQHVAERQSNSDAWDPLDPGNSSPVVAWLASEGSGWLTGQVLQVAGNTVTRMHPWAPVESYQQNEQSRLDADEVGRIVADLFAIRARGVITGS